MADDQAVTKVVVTRDHVTIEHPGGDPATLAALALDTLRRARNIVADPAGPAYGFTLERGGGLDGHRDKRVGGEIAPVRAGKPPADTSWIRSTE